MARLNKKRTVRFSCGVCGQNCGTDYLKCTMCGNRYHTECQAMCADDSDLWKELGLDYVCVTCRTMDGVEFDYLIGMHRLKRAAASKNMNKLKAAVQRELMFKVNLDISTHQSTPLPRIDPVAEQIMDRHVEEFLGDPVRTTGDGNCLFNAVSILLCGNETMSTKLRYHTCLQLVTSSDLYMSHPERTRIQEVSPTYNQACLDAACDGAYSSAWTIMALTDVVKMNIRVFYPRTSSRQDIIYQTLNRLIKPCNQPEAERTIAILWYSISQLPSKGTYYAVNHFAAVTNVKRDSSKKAASMTPVSDISASPQSVSSTSSPPNPSTSSPVNDWSIPKKRRRSSTSTMSSIRGHLNLSNRFEPFSSSEDEESNEETEEVIDNQEYTTMTNSLPGGKVLDIQELFTILTSEDNPLKDIPRGRKDNVYFKVELESKEGRHDFPDDCGPWDSDVGSTVNQMFMVTEDGHWKNVFRKQGNICAQKKVRGRIHYEKITPEPSEILTLHRYYAKLKDNLGYRKRVSRVIEAPDRLAELKTVAVVEYVGAYPFKGTVPHGNSKSREGYVRTNPRVIKEACKRVNNGKKKATEVVNDMVLENSMDAPKSSRQVQDKLYRDIKNSEEGITQTQSVADEILYVLNQLEKNPFVQEVTMSEGSDPVIILYTHEQLLDLQKNCIGSDGSIICVDRTFNLGKVFVTALCYKNRCVIRRKTDSYPVILGPLCLHWDGEKSTYHKFFSHLRSKLNSMDLTFCTDDERALRNALSNNFPQSDFLLCTKHLKDNIRDHLGKKDGCSLKERENIVRAIFSEEEGLVFSKNDVELLQREDDLSIYFQKYPLFKTYYDKHLRGLSIKYVDFSHNSEVLYDN